MISVIRLPIVALLACLATLASAADGVQQRYSLNIPAQTLESALQAVAIAVNGKMLYERDLINGKTSARLQGEFTTEEAVKALLSGTDLTYELTSSSVVLIRQKGGQGTSNPRATAIEQQKDRAQAHEERYPLQLARVLQQVEDKKEAASAKESAAAAESTQSGRNASDLTVTGSRIRVMLGEATPNPVITYTAADIEALGITSFHDLARYIPQLNMDGTHDPETQGNYGSQFRGTSTVFGDLRGLTSSYSLVLVDGRKVPRLQQYNGFDTQDLNGIPMSAVERIEILPAGASAIYGTNAVTGVINFILKKNFDSTELRLTHRNTFDTDTGQQSGSVTHGFSRGPFSLFLNAEFSETNSLAPRDRWWTASADRRPYGGIDGRSQIPGGTGRVRTTNGANLPGLTTSSAAIPAGSDGVNLTVADFANAGPIASRLDTFQHVDNATISNKGISARAQYDWQPWATLFASGRWGEKTAYRPGNYTLPILGTGAVQRGESVGAVRLPAGYTGNPFGVPIIVEKAFWDLIPYLEARETSINPNAEAGLRGDLPGRWAYETYARTSWGEQNQFGSLSLSGGAGLQRFNAAVNNANPALRPILLHDSLQYSPNTDAVMHSLYQHRPITNTTTNWEYSARADGPVWSLRSGDIRAAVSATYNTYAARTVYIPGDTSQNGHVSRAIDGSSKEYALQLQVPLAGKDFRLPGVYDLKLNATLGGTRQDMPSGESTVSDIGLIWQPVRWLTLRANRSESYKLPTLYMAYSPNFTDDTDFGSLGPLIPSLYSIRDPARGNTQVLYDISTTSGGYPDLDPQDGTTRGASIEVDFPLVPGLKFALVYSDTDITNQIVSGSSSFQSIFSFLPQRLTRDPLTAQDQALGYTGGLVTHIDARNLNLSQFRTTNLDINIDYVRSFGGFGRVALGLRGTKALENYEIAIPGAPRTDFSANRYDRHTATASWTRSAWSFGSAVRYSGHYRSGTVAVNSYTQVDAWVDYEFAMSGQRFTGWREQVFDGLKVSLRGLDILPKDPQFQALNGYIYGRGNPYQSQYQIDIRKTF